MTSTALPVFAAPAKQDAKRLKYLQDLTEKLMAAKKEQDAEQERTAKQLLDTEVAAELQQRLRGEAEDEEDFKGSVHGSLIEVQVHELDGSASASTTNVMNAVLSWYGVVKKLQPPKKPKKASDRDPFLNRQFFRIWALCKFFQAIILYRFDNQVQPHFQQFVAFLSGPEDGIVTILREYAKGVSSGHVVDAMAHAASRMETAMREIVLSLTHALDFLVGRDSHAIREHFAAGIDFLEAILLSDEDQTMNQSWFSNIPFPANLQVPLLRTTPGPATKLLTELIAEYSVPEFHQEYINRRNNPASLGDSHVEHALTVQSKVISIYGFPASLMGVMEMRRNVEFYASAGDPVLMTLLHRIHEILDAHQPLPGPAIWHFEAGWRPNHPEVPPAPEDYEADTAGSGVVGEAAALVQTERDTYDRLSVKDSVKFVDNFSFSGPVISVNLDALDQTVIGFGGAFTEASALVFKGLSDELQQEVLELYFGANGIGYNACRVQINSCDFSMGNYSFDDVEDDFNLEHFDKNVTHDTDALLPFIVSARQKVEDAGYASSGLRLLASPWSPPAWMKTNGKMNGSKLPGLRADCQAAWASYFVRWISAYQAHGVPIWAVTVQNEPQHCAPWDACHYTAQQEAAFLGSHLGPALRSNHPEVLIFAFDHNKNNVRDWARVTYRHETAAQYVHGIAFHWYTGDCFDNVRRLHRDFPNAVLLATEQCYESRRFTPGKFQEGHWRFGEGYAHDIIGDLNAGAAGWMDWNLILDINGGPNHVGNFCDAPIIATKPVGEGGDLRIHPQYFFMGHFSKYIPAGSRRLITSVSGSPRYEGPERAYGTCTAEDGMQATAFVRPDGVVAVVVLNCCDIPVDFKLEVASRALKGRIPPHSIQTYLFRCKVKMPKS